MAFLDIPACNDNSAIALTHQNSRIAIILDHPSLDDFKVGRPMQGSYGSVLAQCLSISRLTTGELSLLFVFPNQTSTVGLWSEKAGFTLEGSTYVQSLKDSIEKLNPNVVVPLGECALRAVTEKRGITKWRGSMLTSTLISKPSPTDAKSTSLLQISGLTDGVKVVPSICPKMAVRTYLYRYYLINDLKRIREESFFPDVRLPERTIVTQPSFVDICAYLDFLFEKKPPVSTDIECHKGEISCISFSHESSYGMSVPFDERWTEEEEITLWIKVAKIYNDPRIQKKLQNALFDRSFTMFRNRIIMRGYVHDTMIKHNLNYPDFPKGLGFICSIYSREPYYKDDGKTWFEDLKAGKGDINQFYEYNGKDSCVLHDVDSGITEELVKYKNTETYEFNRRLMEPLLYMMMRGIKVDGPKLVEHRKEAAEHRDELQKQLDTICKAQPAWKKGLNVASPKQCKEYFYEVLNLRPHTITVKDPKTGQRVTRVSTSNKVMKKLTAKGIKEAQLVQQIRAYRKLIGTYLDVKYDKDGRLRCSFNIAGTSTGRLSSSATIFGTGTNMQNLPKIFKEFLVADEGCVMCEMDKAQAEWVVVAYLCGDANMIRTIENREDAHINTAHLMFGAPKDLIKKEDELLGSLSDEEKIREIREKHFPEIFQYHPVANMSMRQAGKKSNHGLNYDLGDNGFAQTYGLPIEEARRCRTLYHNAYPAIKVWHAHIRNQLSRDRTLTNLFGRKRRFLDRWCDNLFKAAYAYIPQSTVAQLLNFGLVAIYEIQCVDGFRFLRDWDLLLQVHDSELFQYPLTNVYGLTNTILACKAALEVPLKANGREFVIRTDAKLGFDAKNLEKVNIEGSFYQVFESVNATISKIKIKRDQKIIEHKAQLLLQQNEELFDNEGEDLPEDKNTKIATPEETCYASIETWV